MYFDEDMIKSLFRYFSDEHLRMITGRQGTDDWYLLRIGRFKSTGAVKVLSQQSSFETIKEEARDDEISLNAAELRQHGTCYGRLELW